VIAKTIAAALVGIQPYCPRIAVVDAHSAWDVPDTRSLRAAQARCKGTEGKRCLKIFEIVGEGEYRATCGPEARSTRGDR
jgi:hypothetical protein